jgi:mannose-6-phosphate isomerase-like protein (cupin superfamily)
VSFYVGRFPPGSGPPLHRHPYEETFIVQEGSATFTIDGQTLEVGAGQIVVVPAAAAHRFVATGAVDLRQVSVHPRDRMVQEDAGS